MSPAPDELCAVEDVSGVFDEVWRRLVVVVEAPPVGLGPGADGPGWALVVAAGTVVGDVLVWAIWATELGEAPPHADKPLAARLMAAARAASSPARAGALVPPRFWGLSVPVVFSARR